MESEQIPRSYRLIFAQNIRQVRRFKEMSQEELAHKAGLSYRSIANYEKDIRQLRAAQYQNIEAIAKALGVQVSDIFLGSTSKI